MDNKIFREKSIQRISSPDEIDNYVKATAPSVWILMAAIIVLLAGVIVWGCVGSLESKSTVGCTVENGGIAVAVVSEADFEKLQKDSYIRIDDKLSLDLSSISGPFQYDAEGSAHGGATTYAIHVSGIQDEGWYYLVRTVIRDVPAGEYRAQLVFEKISPIKFIIN